MMAGLGLSVIEPTGTGRGSASEGPRGLETGSGSAVKCQRDALPL